MTNEKDEVQVEDYDKVEKAVQDRFESGADMQQVLFAVGLNELGPVQDDFSKEEKMDLMNIAFCKIASLDGYFLQDGTDGDGWPVWKQRKPLPKMNKKEQERFIKEGIVVYFTNEGWI